LSLEKKAKTKCLSVSLLCYLAQHHRLSRFNLSASFSKWKNLSSNTKLANNAFTKILKINHKHISARVQAAVVILSQLFRKITTNLLGNSFKLLVHYSVAHANYIKHSYKSDSVYSAYEALKKESVPVTQKRSITPHERILDEKANLQKVIKNSYSPLNREYRPLDSVSTPDTTPHSKSLKSASVQENPKLTANGSLIILNKKVPIDQMPVLPHQDSLQERSRIDSDRQGRRILAENVLTKEFKAALESHLNMRNSSFQSRPTITTITNTETSECESYKPNKLKDSNMYLSKSPRHLSFVHYRENLIDRSQPDPRVPALSEKTKKFLKEFEANKSFNRGHKSSFNNDREILNKSDFEILGKENDESFGALNHSANMGLNLNRRMVFRPSEKF